MNTYSQNGEDILFQQYFGDYVGTLLEIGANDGFSLSNSHALIELGWSALLVEPSDKVFPLLLKLHDGNEKIVLVKAAIGNENGKTTLHDSGGYLLKGTSSLLSTAIPSEKDRWGEHVKWEEYEVPMITFEKLISDSAYKKFDFISVDCEGFDLDILQQMNLEELGCKLICLEHNSVPHVKNKMIEYCAKFGLNRIIGENAENVIIGK